jgi:hypothetical protein
MSPTVALLERLARALDIHISDLFPPKGLRRSTTAKRGSRNAPHKKGAER